MAKEAWQFDAVVHGGADSSVASGGEIGGAADHEELPATGGVAGVIGFARLKERKKAQEHEVDERKKKLLEPRNGELAGKAADEVGVGCLQEAGHSSGAVWGEAHVGIEEAEDVSGGGVGQVSAGVLLAVPAGW